jgi:hypothetical protein
MNKHSVETLKTGSRYVGRQCPVTRTEMKIGDQVIVCSNYDEAISWAALPMIGVRCPYCGQKFTLEEIFEAQQEGHESLTQSDVRKKGKLRSRPYIPSQRRVSLPASLLVMATALGFILLLSIILTVGKQYFFHQSTAVPIPTLLTTLVIETPKLPNVIQTLSPEAEMSNSMKTPQPTATYTPRATPTQQPVVGYHSISLSTQANAALDFASSPNGTVTLSGVPFQLSNRVFKSQASSAPHNNYPTRMSVSLNVPNVYRVHLLLNSGNGFTQFNEKVIGVVFAHCNDSSIRVTDLVLGRDIREWHVEDNVVSTSSRTQQVWTGVIIDFPNLSGHIDMLSLDLPKECQNAKLTGLEIIDSSVDTVGSLDPALNIIGITVEYYQ